MKLENVSYIHQLFGKYLDNKCSAEEKHLLLNYFSSKANEEELKGFILSVLETRETGSGEDIRPDANLETAFRKIMKKISGK